METCFDTTRLLRAWSEGDRQAGEDLFDRLYDQLRGVASRRLAAESPGHRLQTTSLVHEAYLRMVDQDRVSWQDRRQFFAVAARVMRRILVDQARERSAAKRGGSRARLSLDDLPDRALVQRPEELLVLDRCLEDLARLDPEQARLVELRYFVGLSLEQTAETLGCSRATVIRRWRVVKGWLHRQLQLARS